MIEWMLKSYKHAYNLDFVAFRYFNACGADSQARHGQKSGATHIIARVLESIRTNKEFMLNGDDYDTEDGTCVRDYVHVEDIADAHIAAMSQNIPSDIYNLGTKCGISNKEVIAMAQQVTARTVAISVGPRRHGDPAILTASSDRWQTVSNTRPRFTLNDMVAHAWNWYNR
jgi:UDP-glucose 4-epimerase